MMSFSRYAFESKAATMPPEYRGEVLAAVRREDGGKLFIKAGDYARLRAKRQT